MTHKGTPTLKTLFMARDIPNNHALHPVSRTAPTTPM